MTQQYGNSNNALNKLQVLIGKKELPDESKYSQELMDCLTCRVHKSNRLPLNSKGKVNDICVQICKPTLIHMNRVELSNFTRPQLMVKYPKAGLHKSMSKEQMIQAVEIWLLEKELFNEE
jgi:hypothetical protein